MPTQILVLKPPINMFTKSCAEIKYQYIESSISIFIKYQYWSVHHYNYGMYILLLEIKLLPNLIGEIIGSDPVVVGPENSTSGSDPEDTEETPGSSTL